MHSTVRMVIPARTSSHHRNRNALENTMTSAVRSSFNCVIVTLIAVSIMTCVGEQLLAVDTLTDSSLTASNATGGVDCIRNVSVEEKDFDIRFPPPPSFLLPPPPSVLLTNGSTNFAWRLVPSSGNDTSNSWIDSSPAAKCLYPVVKPPAVEADNTSLANSSLSASSNVTTPSSESNTTTTIDATNTTSTCQACQPCRCMKEKELNKIRKIRAKPGPTGPQGPPGPEGPTGSQGEQGLRGNDGVPGLVVFANAAAMHAVQLEGLIAYRMDVKQLFVRDNQTWRSIRLSRCGDNVVDHEVGEQCDDGNTNRNDDCINCRKAYCGDGIRNARTEQCDGRDFGQQSCASLHKNLYNSVR